MHEFKFRIAVPATLDAISEGRAVNMPSVNAQLGALSHIEEMPQGTRVTSFVRRWQFHPQQHPPRLLLDVKCAIAQDTATPALVRHLQDTVLALVVANLHPEKAE